VNLAGLFVQDVRASVLPNMSGEKVLLGMSDLERLEMSHLDDTLTLRSAMG
jgi:aspartyl protease family protein